MNRVGMILSSLTGGVLLTGEPKQFGRKISAHHAQLAQKEAGDKKICDEEDEMI